MKKVTSITVEDSVLKEMRKRNINLSSFCEEQMKKAIVDKESMLAKISQMNEELTELYLRVKDTDEAREAVKSFLADVDIIIMNSNNTSEIMHPLHRFWQHIFHYDCGFINFEKECNERMSKK